ncbi:hypothetical protein [Amycolatopsis sp. NBC_00438]|uniref:hypothetical protein n=1 Tax=Amycolatopsis sp. NBC_00438 TaxID=2903558 RepID=UPI002E1D8EE2
MITKFSDLTEAERSYLGAEARIAAGRWEERTALDDEKRRALAARWREIAEAIENGGKQPHSVEPGGYRQLPDGTGWVRDDGTGEGDC